MLFRSLNDFYLTTTGSKSSEAVKIRVLYFSTLLIALAGAGVAMAMINTKSVLDTWWKLASVFSGGILGLFLLALFTRARDNTGAVAGVAVAVLVILSMTISSLVLPPASFLNQFHPYLSIVFGTTALLLTAVVVNAFSKLKH